MNKPINKITKKKLFKEIENKYDQLMDKVSEVEKKKLLDEIK